MSRDTPALAFWRLLKTGVDLPQGSSHITVDGRLCGVLSRELGMPYEQAYRALYGLPVRHVYNLTVWSRRVEPEAPRRALVNAAAKAKERKTAA